MCAKFCFIVYTTSLHLANTVLPNVMCITVIQVNQIGTVTEAIEVVKQARDAQWGLVTSHRCGETEDSFISDLSVGLATGVIKAGAPCRGERTMKYNQVCASFSNFSFLRTPISKNTKYAIRL